MRVQFHEQVGGEAIGDIVAPTESLTTEICGKPVEVAMLACLLGFTPPPPPRIEIVHNIDIVLPVGDLDAAFGPVPGSAEAEADAVREERVTHEQLLYLLDNSYIPPGRVSSTARKGSKWFTKVGVGDVVDLVATETGKKFGEAVIVAKEFLDLDAVLDNAGHNHVAFGDKVNKHTSARHALEGELASAYGPLNLDDSYTVLHILPLNGTTLT